MYKAIEKASGKKQNINGHRIGRKKNWKQHPVKWWSKECQDATQEKKEKLKKYVGKQDMRTFIEYKRSCALTKRIIKQRKRESFYEFCNKINHSPKKSK